MKKLPAGEHEKAEFVRLTKDISLFASMMNMGVMEKILSYVALFECEAGEKIFAQGDEGDAFYAVRSGSLKVTVREAFFFSRKIAALKEGDFFGEIALINCGPRTATVACETPATLFALRAEHFNTVLRDNPEFSEEMTKLASDRLFELKRGS